MAENTGRLLIKNGKIVTETGIIERGYVFVEDGYIRGIYEEEPAAAEAELDADNGDQLVDAEGGWVLPGFIDVHVHGGYGADFMEASKDNLDTITRFHGLHGTTSMLATTVTASREMLEQVLDSVCSYIKDGMPYAQLLGVHLEGPFISPKWPGAQNPAYIVPPALEWLEEWENRYPGLIKMLTLAPETEGAIKLIAWLRTHGIVAACGHTDASYAEIETAVQHGLNHAVHTFNAMTGLHHREPGTAGAVLTDDRLSCEVIADGHHVHPAVIKLLARAKPADRLLLITDAIAAAGLGDGEYELGGLAVTVQGGVARLTDGGSLAGSTLTMIDAFRFVVSETGLSVPEASRLASSNPSLLLDIAHLTGSLQAGKRADIAVVTPEPDLRIRHVWSKGTEIL